MSYYKNNNRYLDKKTHEIIQQAYKKYEIIHIGCMPTTAHMEFK